MTALAHACYKGQDVAAVKLLLEAGADKDALDMNGQTPLMITMANREAAIARLLIDAGAALDKVDAHGSTAESLAETAGLSEIAQLIRDTQAACRKQPAAAGRPVVSAEEARAKGRLLYDAILVGNEADALRLIGEGAADVDFIGDKAGFSPLILASAEGADKVVARLVAAGAKLDLTDASHESALMKACAEGVRGRAAALALIEAGANVNVVSRGGETALDFAQHAENFAPVRTALRAKGAVTGAELKARAESRRKGELEMEL